MKNHSTATTGVVSKDCLFAVTICSLLWGIGVAAMATAQPANDNFANRTPIHFNKGRVSGTISNATSEVGEPLIADISSGQTAWWTWKAPSDGILTITSAATSFSPLVTVYTGNALSELSLVASNNYLACYVYPASDQVSECGCHWRMRALETFHVFRGQQYQICADSPIVTDSSIVQVQEPLTYTNNDGVVQTVYLETHQPLETTNVSPGNGMNLALAFTPAPPNDAFDKPVKLAGLRTRIGASNKGATKEPGEPDPEDNSGGSSVWFRWVAPASGRVTLSTNEIPPYAPPSSGGTGGVVTTTGNPFDCGYLTDLNPPPQFYPVLSAYTGAAVDALAPANCLPMGLDAYPYAVEFDAVQGNTYHIAFDGNMGTTGNATLFLSLTTPAANDAFKKRIRLSGINVAVSGYNAGATHEAGAPTVAGSVGKNSWWTWTAPVSGTVVVDLSGSDFAFPVGIFTGTTVNNLALAASGSGAVSFPAVQGDTYQISVADAAGLTGKIKFTMQAPVVDLALQGTPLRSAGLTLLTYSASAGQVVLLQSSKDNGAWKNVRTATAHHDKISFAVSTANITKGTSYRAIVVNYISVF